MYAVTAFLIKTLYAILSALFPMKNRIVFLSRQSDSASLDFSLLKDCLKENMSDWDIAESYHFRQTLPSIVRDVFLVATSRVCILDGYIPAVSIPKVRQELLVVQLWHAMGAIKRFGWQAVGLKSGRPENMAKSLSMHANYSAIIAAGNGCIPAFTEAFRCSEEEVVVLGLPRMDYLFGMKKPDKGTLTNDSMSVKSPELTPDRITILYVPTFRERENDAKEIETYVSQLASAFPADTYSLLVSTHPFSTGAENTKNKDSIIHAPHIQSIDLLKYADYVATDYSAIAFEAALIRKKVLFFVPDIETYRVSPGLNIDMEDSFPQISFRLAKDLESFVEQESVQNSYESTGFWEFCDDYLISSPEGSTERIVKYIRDRVI